MGGQIDWNALPLLAELVGVQDVEGLILDLVTIRSHMTTQEA